MNVFLPYERDFKKSIQSLDDVRLNKQVLECYQLLNNYVRMIQGETKVVYIHHPVFKHFTESEINYQALMKYANETCIEYQYRFGVEHKLCKEINEWWDYPEDIEKLYTPYFMRGSLGQPEYIRTTENVSKLFQERLVDKWKSDKRQPRWTKREVPEFYEI
jgi:hypothetical protein